jgi:hypothetical protein
LRAGFGPELILEQDLGIVEHAYTHRRVSVHVYSARLGALASAGIWADGREHAWVSMEGWSAHAMPKLAHKMAALVTYSRP